MASHRHGESAPLLSAVDGKGGEQDGDYRAYPARWLMLTLFCSVTFTNAFLWITFASISAFAKDFFGVGTLGVNMLSMVFMIMYLPGTLVSAYIYDRYDLRVGLSVGAGMNAVGGFIRYFGCLMPPDALGTPYSRYIVVMVGQCITAVAQPFFTNSPAKLAGRWFPMKEREVATTIAAMLNPLGNAAAAVVPPLLVMHSGDITRLMLYEALFATLTFVSPALFFKDRPPTPPSRSAHKRADLRNESFRVAKKGATTGLTPTASASTSVDVRAATVVDDAASVDSDGSDEGHQTAQRLWLEVVGLMKDKNFVMLMCGFSVGLGLFNALLTLIAQIVQPCGYGPTEAGAFGGVLIGAGLLGAAAVGPILEKTKAYRPVLKGGLVACLVGVTIFLVSLRPDNFALVCASFGIMGFLMMPMLPVVLENCAESTYPLPEETGSAALLLGGNIFGIVFILALDKLIAMRPHYEGVVNPTSELIFVVMILAVASVACYNGQYLRLAHERQGARQHSINK